MRKGGRSIRGGVIHGDEPGKLMPDPVAFGNCSPDVDFRIIYYHDIVNLLKSLPEGRQYNDGSIEYKRAVVNATIDVADPSCLDLEGRLDEYFTAATEVNPVLRNTHPRFTLYPLDIGNEKLFNTALIPVYTEAEVQAMIYEVIDSTDIKPSNFERDDWRSALVNRGVLFNVVDDYSVLEMGSLLHRHLVRLNPGLSEENAKVFLRRLEDDPKFAVYCNRNTDGTFRMPRDLVKLLYVPSERDTEAKVVGRPDIDEMMAWDLRLLEAYRTADAEGRKAIELENRLFIGDPGTGKTTAMRAFAYKAYLAGIPVFDLDGGVNGEEGHNPTSMIKKALDLISAYSELTGLPCLIIWDDMTELIKNDSRAGLDRDNFTATLKRMIGGISDSSGVLIYATGNHTDGIEAFYTEKRFGKKPIYMESSLDLQVKIAIGKMEQLGFRDIPDIDDVRQFIKALPDFSNETIAANVDRANSAARLGPGARGYPVFEDFVGQITKEIIGDSQESELDRNETIERARYVAGVITVSLALGSVPFAAKTMPTRVSHMPDIYLNLDGYIRHDHAVATLAYSGGMVALEDAFNPSRLREDLSMQGRYIRTDVPQNAESVAGRSVKAMVDRLAMSAEGIDTLSDVRHDLGRPTEMWIYEDTMKFCTDQARKILASNRDLYECLVDMLLENDVLNYSQIRQFESQVKEAYQVPGKFFKSIGPHNYVARPTVNLGATMGLIQHAANNGGDY